MSLKQYALDQIHEDPDLFGGVQQILQRAVEENTRIHYPALQAWIESTDRELSEKHRNDLLRKDGWDLALNFIAREFQMEEIYDQPDGQEY